MTPSITGRTGGRPATLADYLALFQPSERPRKFSAAEVGFLLHPRGVNYCMGCRHYFINGTVASGGAGRRVCEIMRLPGEKPIPPDSVCKFWNQDGVNFPLL